MELLSRPEQSSQQGVISERRAQSRFQPVDGAFAFLSLKAMVAGQILDISKTGLSFRYVASRQQSQDPHIVEIIVRGRDFRSKRLPCRTVWDHATSGESSFGPYAIRYCGLRFEKLTEEQRADLNYFIGHYAAFSRRP
jgi:hypothetical protein